MGGAGMGGAGMGGAGMAGNGGAGKGGAPMDAAADGDGASGSGGAPIDASSDAPGGCTTNCQLKVQYACRQNGANVTNPEFSIVVYNTGTQPVALNTVTVRYWYTTDGTGTQSALCVTALPSCAAVSFSFQPVTPAKATANEYLEIAFTMATTLAAGANTGEIRIGLRNSMNANFNQTNDYSFVNAGAFQDWANITAYTSGNLAWGTPP
jgi:hypothetical protein